MQITNSVWFLVLSGLSRQKISSFSVSNHMNSPWFDDFKFLANQRIGELLSCCCEICSVWAFEIRKEYGRSVYKISSFGDKRLFSKVILGVNFIRTIFHIFSTTSFYCFLKVIKQVANDVLFIIYYFGFFNTLTSIYYLVL